MTRVVLAGIAAVSLCSAADVLRIRTGPFELVSLAGEGAVRDRALEAEQFRHVFATLTGVKEPVSSWPIRVLVRKNAKSGPLRLSRDSFTSEAGHDQALSHEWMASCAQVLLESNIQRMPAEIETGLMSLLSTLEIKGTKLTLGAPPPAGQRTRGWARLHMLATDPELSSRTRIFLYNLTQGADLDTAYRNAYEKRAAEMEKRVEAYLAAGKFEAVPFPGRALADRDFTVREVAALEGLAAAADLQATEAAYSSLPSPQREEGLGWLAERAGRTGEARKHYAAAVEAASTSARAWAAQNTREALAKAAELNPLWPEPWSRLAALETDPARKAAALQKAAQLARRDASLWAALAMALQDANRYPEAARAWTQAQTAATSEDEREKLRAQRRDVEAKRAEFEAAERRRIAEEEARELQRLRDQAMSEIRAAESKARSEMQKDGAKPEKVEEWWDDATGPKEKAAGRLVSIECLRAGSRWVVLTDSGKRVTLRVPDPSKIALTGKAPSNLGCGPQKPPRRVAVEYSGGELRAVEFP